MWNGEYLNAEWGMRNAEEGRGGLKGEGIEDEKLRRLEDWWRFKD